MNWVRHRNHLAGSSLPSVTAAANPDQSDIIVPGRREPIIRGRVDRSGVSWPWQSSSRQATAGSAFGGSYSSGQSDRLPGHALRESSPRSPSCSRSTTWSRGTCRSPSFAARAALRGHRRDARRRFYGPAAPVRRPRVDGSARLTCWPASLRRDLILHRGRRSSTSLLGSFLEAIILILFWHLRLLSLCSHDGTLPRRVGVFVSLGTAVPTGRPKPGHIAYGKYSRPWRS